MFLNLYILIQIKMLIIIYFILLTQSILTSRREGIEIGIKSGKKELLRQQIEKKLAKGKSVEVIADELEEEVASIQKILDEIIAEAEEK